jgi:metal-responsive CopG/Arc/MetJ family transcriptional regulator
MRVDKIEPRHTFSINLPTSLYQKVVEKAGRGKVSTFIREILEKELGEEQLKQQLILSHQRAAKNQKLKKELEVWDEAVDDYINKDNGKN